MINRRQFIIRSAGASALICTAPGMVTCSSVPKSNIANLLEGWQNPSRSYRPHTRWWWHNSAITREGISWQLQQMRQKGMGGVEIMDAGGPSLSGIDYLSEQWLDLVRYTIETARSLDLEVSITMGPGWAFGGEFRQTHS